MDELYSRKTRDQAQRGKEFKSAAADILPKESRVSRDEQLKPDAPPTKPVKVEDKDFELEPIEAYKGKSIEELEAILDAHNNARANKPEPK